MVELVHDCNKNQQRYDKAVDNYPHALILFIIAMTQKMCVNTHPSIIKCVSDQLKTHKICDKAVDSCFFVFYSTLDQYKTPEICGRVVYKDLSLITYCPDKYKTQRMCDEAVDDSLIAFKFIPDWFVINKMIKTLLTGLYTSDYVML